MPITCYPGKWTDVTSDSSVQIISLDHTVQDEMSIYSDEKIRRTDSDIRAIQDKNTDNGICDKLKFGPDFITKSYVDLNVVLNKHDQLVHHRGSDNFPPCNSPENGLSGKVWFSDSCLNDPIFRRHTENKEFASTGDLTNGYENTAKQSWKPILRRPSKTRRTVKKSVSFKASEAETRYFIKCDINENDECDSDTNQACTEFDIRHTEVDVKTDVSSDSDEELIMKKPILPSSEAKVAKVVKCQTVSKHSTSYTVKRKLVQNNKDNNRLCSSAPNSEQSEIDELFPELACKIPRYSAKKRNHTDIGPLSKFLMENAWDNDSKMLTSTPNMLTKTCPNIFEDGNKTISSQHETPVESYQHFPAGSRTHLRMGTSNLKTVRCQRKLSFNECVNRNISEDISSIDQQLESVQCSPKPVRLRLGVHCKTSKLVPLDSFDINLVCELKNKISKCNTGMKIKTNGSLTCKSEPKTTFASPMGRCFKSSVRPSPVSTKSFRVAPYLETFV